MQLILATRFIPAGAGNTLSAPLQTGRQTVYPRWRGEHDYVIEDYGMIAGLSPLARGTH